MASGYLEMPLTQQNEGEGYDVGGAGVVGTLVESGGDRLPKSGYVVVEDHQEQGEHGNERSGSEKRSIWGGRQLIEGSECWE